MGTSSVGKGGSVKKSSAEEGLLSIATNLINQSEPLRTEVMGQTLESLRTGGVGAGLPIVQRSIEGSRAATSAALGQIGESMDRQGLGGSSYKNSLMADTALRGAQTTEAIPQQWAEKFIEGAPSMMLGVTGQGLGGYSSATGAANQRSGIQAQRDIAKGNQQTQMLTSMMGAAAMAAGCWIAAALYGWDSERFYAARHFIFDQWERPAWLVRRVRVAYVRHGPWVAESRWRCEVMRPLFAVAWRLGRKGWREAQVERRLSVREV